ncbi:CocE/NonD family hydrolase [Parahaliea maris]|uniref:CocE/NonD family hydrolase n=1 Tax=Parahaliea maris TaxID=2716870 RepID=UPI00164F5D20|nr:CocE/NonD family hydrolase [Parahaliea maris]
MTKAQAAPEDSFYNPLAEHAIPRPLYTSYQRQAFYVPMEDGTRLAATVYTPAQGPDRGRFPAILWYMPGHRESIDLDTGEIVSAFSTAEIAFYTSHGYALVAAEMRGSGASFGQRELDRGPQVGRDGKALIDWIAGQPWSSGAVGMVGRSYQGFSQYATAAERPTALKAIFPEIAGFDDYTSMFYPGGILVEALSASASASIARDDQNHYAPTEKRRRLPSVPVIDEDGDGELVDEIPLDQDGDGAFLDDGPPLYADGQERSDLYYLATREHLANANLTVEKLAAAPYRDSAIDDTPYSYVDIDPADRVARIASSGIAVYHRGGWFDYHARDTVMWHATLAGHTPSHLLMAPTAHGGLLNKTLADYRSGPYFSFFNDSWSSEQGLNREKLRFFDHYLRGIDNGFADNPPVLLYVMGQGWRYEHEWPLARQALTAFYFQADGSLGVSPGQGVSRYRVDFNADSRTDGANRWNYRLASSHSVMQAAAANGQRLSYTGPVLAAATEVTGHPVVHLQLSSSHPEGDVYVYLEDVAPDGRVLLVTEGQLRANYAGLKPVQAMLGPGARVAVRPALPWHGYGADDYQPAPFADGRVVNIVLDLMPTAWVFKAGHRIRLSVTAADHPSFARHPALGGLSADQAPEYRVQLGEGSKLVLPVIPAPNSSQQ